MASKHHDDHDHSHHVIPVPKLVGTLFALLGLMVLTIAAARWQVMVDNIPGPYIDNLVALGIAMLKAFFVIWIFMGVKHGTKLIKVYAIGGFVWMLLIGGALFDYFFRDVEPVQGWEPAYETSLPRGDSVESGTDSEASIRFVPAGGHDEEGKDGYGDDH